MRMFNENFASLDGPISTLHDEIFAMIFEAGAVEEMVPYCTFGILVSHITRRWRNIGLATPQLWTKTWCTKPIDRQIFGSMRACVYPAGERERFSAFLFRSRSFPIEIHIRFLCKPDLDEEKWVDLLQLICNHMDHCRHLCIKDGDDDGLPELLFQISCRPTPLLSSIELSIDEDDDFARHTQISDLSLLSGAPRLTSAKLSRIEFPSLLSYLPTLQYLTSLQLSLSTHSERQFAALSFWDAIMTLKALDHLELEIMEDMATRVPVVLHTIRYLALTIHYWYPEISDAFVFSIHAPSVVTLWLDYVPLDDDYVGLLEFYFPSMQHLILADVNIHMGTRIIPVFARIFPAIMRLTYHFTDMVPFATHDVLAAMVPHLIDLSQLCWPKLQTVTLDAFNTSLGDKGFHDTIQVLKEAAGHPIRQLTLPKNVLSKAAEEEEITAL